MAWLYVPGMEALNWELNESYQEQEPFVMWRGNVLPFNTLSKKWKKVAWMTRLSGLTSKPSEANSGVEKWIGSLEDSHVNPILELENNWGKKTQETYGSILSESLGKCDQDSYSLRMFQTSLNFDLIKLSLTSINWGMMLHGVLWQLPTLGPCTEEEGGSSLVFGTLIPTPTTQGNAQVAGQYSKKTGTTLAGYVKMKEYGVMWPTPTTKGWGHASEGQTAALIKKVEKGILSIQEAEKMLNLKDIRNHRTFKKMFPTPAARDFKGPYPRKNGGGLPDLVEEWKMNGEGNSMNGGRLNPEWVAWLMGLPIGWINSEYSEME
jgi:hypothetical protein